jgi:DNA-binding transcriptional regulator LsrR (DeoR family)
VVTPCAYLTVVRNVCKLRIVARDRQLAHAYAAAHLYYEKGLTQEVVARRMEVSRPTVSKLLALANKEGIVRVSVRRPGQRDAGIEAALVDALGLRAALVFPSAGGGAPVREIMLAQGTLELLKETLRTLPKVEFLGLGWGRAMLAFVEALEQRSDVFLGGTAEVVPLIGGSGQSLEIFQINEIVRRAANAVGASARLLPAPALVKNERLRTALLAEASSRPVVEAWRKLDIAIVGIGRRLDPSYLAGYLQDGPLQHESLVRSSVSDVCSHYFAEDGTTLGEELDARLIAARRDEFERIPLTIGVAGGPKKAAGIVGAVRARLINALVTDEETANVCLQIPEAA